MRFIRRLRDERGMTMIELLVAATICSVGCIATIGVLDKSREVAVKSEKREAMAHQAEREIERIMEIPWANLAHLQYPTSSASPSGNPSTYIAGTAFAWDRTNPGASEQLVQSAAGQVEHTSAAWDDAQSRVSGRMYRYVTRIDANSRRITVGITADGRDAPPVLLVSSIKVNPIL